MISIIIPVYNQAQYLTEAIESALAQTAPCEIIIVNDGSTDGSLQIAQGYEKSHGIKVINQVNKGLPSARNTGIMNSYGDYILPLDADDMLLETCVEKMELAIKESKADVIAPSFKAFGISNETVILQVIPSLDEFKIANRIGYFSAIKRSVLKEIGGYNPRMIWGYEDWDMWIDIFKRDKKLCMLKEVLALYRTKSESMLTESDRHRDELLSQMKKNHPEVYV